MKNARRSQASDTRETTQSWAGEVNKDFLFWIFVLKENFFLLGVSVEEKIKTKIRGEQRKLHLKWIVYCFSSLFRHVHEANFNKLTYLSNNSKALFILYAKFVCCQFCWLKKNNLKFVVVRTNKELASVLFSGQMNVRYFNDDFEFLFWVYSCNKTRREYAGFAYRSRCEHLCLWNMQTQWTLSVFSSKRTFNGKWRVCPMAVKSGPLGSGD